MNGWIVGVTFYGRNEADNPVKVFGGFGSCADAVEWVAEVACGWRFYQCSEVLEVLPYDLTADGGDS